jgi:hypothetical protein
MKKYKKYIILIVLIVGGIFLYIYGLTYAKYVFNSAWDYYLKSKGFYFSSDYLGTTAAKNVNNLWNGDSVHFNIKNNLNQVVMTDYDISYSIVCTVQGDAAAYTACHLNGTTSNTEIGVLPSIQSCVNNTTDGINVSAFTQTECESKGYNWVVQISEKDLYFDVILTNNNYELNDVVVNVAVTTTSPYHKVISGDFTLHKSIMQEDNLSMKYKNYSNYDRLIITNSYSSNKCVRLTWDANKLMINEDTSKFSSYLTDTNGYINEIKFNIGAKNNLNYIFYKKDFSATYNVNEFLIEESSGC